MDPQAPPPSAVAAPSAATYTQHRSHYDGQYNGEVHDARHQSLHPQRDSRSSHPRSHDSVMSRPFSPKPSNPPSPASSISSVPSRNRGSRQEIQQFPAENVSYPQRAHLDPEKADASFHRRDQDITTVMYDSSEYMEKGPEEKPIQLLLFLSGPCAILSLVITLWTILALFTSLLLQPFRLCSKDRPTLGAQLTNFLAPPLNLQLHLVYSFSSATEYSVPMLVIVHLFSPIVAIGVAIGAWTSAFFWFFSAILGDPAGQDEDHNDGKDSLLGVRRWWDKWLSRALRKD